MTETSCVARRLRNAPCSHLLENDALVSEQPSLSIDAAAIARKTSISANDPVARNHDGNRVCPIGKANGSNRLRTPQLERQRAVTERRPSPNCRKCGPDIALEGRTVGRDRNAIGRQQISREIVAQRMLNCLGYRAVFQGEVISLRSIMEPKEAPHARFKVVKVQSAYTAFGIMDEKYCPNWALKAIHVQHRRRS
jgi:hypothetical protein